MGHIRRHSVIGVDGAEEVRFSISAQPRSHASAGLGDSCDRCTSRREQAAISNFKARNGVSHASALRNFAIIEQKERLTWN